MSDEGAAMMRAKIFFAARAVRFTGEKQNFPRTDAQAALKNQCQVRAKTKTRPYSTGRFAFACVKMSGAGKPV